MEAVKQVIVIRKDLKMRRGKEIAQGAHASMIWLANRVKPRPWYVRFWCWLTRKGRFSQEEQAWLTGLFTKVCLQVDSEQELLEIYQAAVQAGLNAHLVTDAGLTEFNGVPTNTCCGIGPNAASRIDAITRHLKLY